MASSPSNSSHGYPKPARIQALLKRAGDARVLVIGDVMLDQFIWGSVGRISPEAPVPIVDFERESFIPGGAANVARNLAALGCPAKIYSVVGDDRAGEQLQNLLSAQHVNCRHLLRHPKRFTSIKTRIVAHRQQVVRVDRESKEELDEAATRGLIAAVARDIRHCDAVIVGDYGKGLVSQTLLDALKELCRAHGVWLSLDPKPVHRLDLRGLSLITPNRKEAFELARMTEAPRDRDPLRDKGLRAVARALFEELEPALLLITLGEQGMLLCQRDTPPLHIPTVAQEVFDVSGAGDTVIACFTLAIASGASPVEAALLSNHAAGVVVGKIGTAVVSPEEISRSLADAHRG
ncbi:MAG: D-glycero-beta-D-manno-heptose-7-phosphate kinase [Verrucomicrobiales bacterium]|nr:D-glycero-beta-D-manno-heptose-7-phosphate kinase [Verrucomicrobiales bacterium]